MSYFYIADFIEDKIQEYRTKEISDDFKGVVEALELAMEAIYMCQSSNSPSTNRKGDALEKEVAKLLGWHEND
jgi:hypothetical protein